MRRRINHILNAITARLSRRSGQLAGPREGGKTGGNANVEVHPAERALLVLVVPAEVSTLAEHVVEVRFHDENDAREFAAWVAVKAECPHHIYEAQP
jgi:hypothetical protein